MAVTPDTAQWIADTLGVLLPTDRIADLAHAQADVRLTPHPQTPVTATTEAMRVDGRDVSTAEVMMSPELAGLVSYQGPLLGARYPLPPEPALNQSNRWNTASGSTHETSSPVDAEDTESPFDPFADLRRKATRGR